MFNRRNRTLVCGWVAVDIETLPYPADTHLLVLCVALALCVCRKRARKKRARKKRARKKRAWARQHMPGREERMDEWMDVRPYVRTYTYVASC